MWTGSAFHATRGENAKFHSSHVYVEEENYGTKQTKQHSVPQNPGTSTRSIGCVET